MLSVYRLAKAKRRCGDNEDKKGGKPIKRTKNTPDMNK